MIKASFFFFFLQWILTNNNTDFLFPQKSWLKKKNCTRRCVVYGRERNFCIRPQYCYRREVRDHGAEEKEEPFYVLAMHTINYSWWRWAEKVIARSHHNVDSKVLLLLPMKNGDLMSSLLQGVPKISSHSQGWASQIN